MQSKFISFIHLIALAFCCILIILKQINEYLDKFIEQVNPYEKKPSLGIDLRALSWYAH